MRFVSVTITSSRAKIIGDALRSVRDWVDAALIVDLGIEDDTLDVAREVMGAGRVHVVRHEWQDDTAAARNAGLEAAERMGAEWAVILDTDERLHLNADDLSKLDAKRQWNVTHVNGEYTKVRFIRLPAARRFIGAAHEVYPNDPGDTPLPKMRFDELPKTAEQNKERFLYIERCMRKQVEQEPKNPRPWYYLGDSLLGQGRHDEAIEAFLKCADLRGHNEESAFACFRAASLLTDSGRHQEAVERAAWGMARHPGMPELPFAAAVASFRLGDTGAAWLWSRTAATHGLYRGDGKHVPRVGFRYVPALYEGPYEVAWRALEALGNVKEAQVAKTDYEAAKAMREAA